MPDARTIPAPSGRGRPHVMPPLEGDDSPAAWLTRLAASTPRLADELHQQARLVQGDGDLTEQGKAKSLTRAVVSEVRKFQNRLREEAARAAKQRRELDEAVARKAGGDRVPESRQAEWRAVLRGMSRDERVELLRAAAAGEAPASDEIIATVLASPSPLLLGLSGSDPLLDVIASDHRERLAGPEVREIAQLEQAEAIARAAEEWVLDYAASLIGGEAALRDAVAVAGGARSLAELSDAQKARRISEAAEAGVTGVDALFRPAEGETTGTDRPPLTEADVARFAALPLSAKTALATEHADDLAAAIRAAARGE